MRYYIIAGEASGDLHGGALIKGLHRSDPDARIRFWGGGRMQDADPGASMAMHYREAAVMGLGDVVAKAGRIAANLSFCKEDIINFQPDAVILIDYPGFNFKIAEFAHAQGIKVFWYIAPKTWATREKRNEKLKRYVDRLFIIFPFEEQYFTSRGIPCTYLGNPLTDSVDSHNYERPVEGRYIALLPGSRKGEIARMMPVCMEVADLLGRQLVIAGAPSMTEEDYARYLGRRGNVRLLFDRTYDILKYADAAIINSGTASLEAALIGTPQVVCWSSGFLTVWIARHILKIASHIHYISLGNLILDKPVVRELIQEDFTSSAVFAELRRITEDSIYRKRMLDGYQQIRRTLGGTGASYRIASEMVECLRGRSTSPTGL